LALALMLLPAGLLPAQAQTQASRKQPVPEPSAAVQPCPEMGPGFFRQAGSTTCVRISGFVRGEVKLRDRRSEATTPGAPAGVQPAARADLKLETLTPTANGPFRAMVVVRGMRPGDGR
jgi:hypothetical protein